MVRSNERHLYVVHGKLGIVPGGKGGIRPENGTDLEDLFESSRHCHLLIKLRGLGKIGRPIEILDFKEFRP
jgi:hypothetical protein